MFVGSLEVTHRFKYAQSTPLATHMSVGLLEVAYGAETVQSMALLHTLFVGPLVS